VSSGGVVVGGSSSRGLLSLAPQTVALRLNTLLPGESVSLVIDVFITSTGQHGLITSCATARSGDEEATTCSGVRAYEVTATPTATPTPVPVLPTVTPVPIDFPTATATPEQATTAPDIAAPVGPVQSGAWCVQLGGMTVTCFPLVRWGGLVAGLAAAGWGVWEWRRRRAG
jgi:hypothetical protein